MDILKFITAGNVDDGKSTLIGRLFYDTGNIKDDVLKTVSEDDSINLAHVTDGLRSEREQGITIDVAYKYLTTLNRKYIITDAPGHFQYTKNLVTGASNADLIIILIDAINGITEQTRRHSLVASFLRIPQVIVAVNKMDAMNYKEETFLSIQNDYLTIANRLRLQNVTFIPMSALLGDNVIVPSENMAWYKRPTLMQCLENSKPILPGNNVTRFSIQYIINSTDTGLEKGYAGKLLSGNLKVGDQVFIYPQIKYSVIKRMIHGNTSCFAAKAGDNITLYFHKKTETERGNLICKVSDNASPKNQKKIEATICWLDTKKPLRLHEEYLLRINAFETTCRITQIINKIDVESFEKYTDNEPVAVNQFARVVVEADNIVAYDSYNESPETGRGILIDVKTNYTSAAFIIEDAN